MRRVGALPVLALGVALLCESTAVARPGFGVFATINGKKFTAPSTGKPDDRCVSGNYVASGGIVFGAIECRGRGHRRRSRRNPKVLEFACGVIDPNQPPPTPPFEAPCLAAGYTEIRTGRHGIPVSMKQWLSTISLQPGPDGTVVERSSVNIRIDSFDGTYVRGAFFGVFDTPPPGTPTQAPISGEGRFYFPVREVAQ